MRLAQAGGADVLAKLIDAASKLAEDSGNKFTQLNRDLEQSLSRDSANMTPLDMLNIQLSASQLTREVGKLQEFVGIMEQSATLVAGTNPAPGGRKQV